jgi:hypothetical protein
MKWNVYYSLAAWILLIWVAGWYFGNEPIDKFCTVLAMFAVAAAHIIKGTRHTQ